MLAKWIKLKTAMKRDNRHSNKKIHWTPITIVDVTDNEGIYTLIPTYDDMMYLLSQQIKRSAEQ